VTGQPRPAKTWGWLKPPQGAVGGGRITLKGQTQFGFFGFGPRGWLRARPPLRAMGVASTTLHTFFFFKKK
jgi:hypothetical protein